MYIFGRNNGERSCHAELVSASQTMDRHLAPNFCDAETSSA